MNRRWICVVLAVLALSTVPALARAVTATTSTGGALGGYIPGAAHVAGAMTPLGISPGQPIANPRTHTLYVALQCGDPTSGKTCSATAGHVLDVLDTTKCKPGARCRVIAKAQAGKIPLAEAIDLKTDTIYVGNATGTVTVVNGARCNAAVTSGCNKPLATIKTGGFIVALAFDPKTRTIYATNAGPKGSVLVIDAAKCNASTTSGCGQPVKKVSDPLIPDAVAVDVSSDTVYAANGGPDGNGNTVSVINGAACNAHTASGCSQSPHTINVGTGAAWVAVDQATHTVYVANARDGSVSVINAANCNAKVRSGCHAIPAAPTGGGVGFLVVDDSRHTVFALNQDDDTLSAINTHTCSSKATSGCRKRVPNEQATFNPPYGYNPNQLALIPNTGTAYLVNVGGEPFLGAIRVTRCNAERTSGCRVEAPTARNQEFLMSLDPNTHTIYAGNQNRPRIDVLDAATCNAAHLSGCAPVGEIPVANKQANVGAIDDETHTLYASDPFGNTISVINIAHCKASDTTGCSAVAPTTTVGPGPGQPVFDRKTHTLYAPDGPESNQVAVLDASTCNASNTSGCGQTPVQVPVGNATFNIALSSAKNTIYAPATGFISGNLRKTVAVINGATCNAREHSGCAHPVATVKVGLAPFGAAVNDRTHTLYVANNQNGDLPGTVSLIDTNTCNGFHTVGCTGRKPAVLVGRSPGNVAIDASNDRVYVTNFASASISVLDGSRCGADRPNGCAKSVRDQPVGSVPQGLVVDPTAQSVYATNLISPPSLSIFDTAP